MVRKSRTEGAKAKPAKAEPIVPLKDDEAEIAKGAEAISAALAEPEAAEDKPADPVPGDNGDALDRIAAFFQKTHPEDWENIRLTPLQHGLVHMADLLRARG